MKNPITTFHRWYDSINSQGLRLIIFLVIASPLFLAAYPPLLIKFGAGWFVGCIGWTLFLLGARRQYVVRNRTRRARGFRKDGPKPPR